MIYSQNIEKQISNKMNGIFKKTREEAIAYAKEFWPETANQMAIEEANYELNTLNQSRIDEENGVEEQIREFRLQEELEYERMALEQEELYLAGMGNF